MMSTGNREAPHFRNTPRAQAGVSFFGFVLIAALVALGVLVGFKLIPAYVEYFSLKNILTTLANAPDSRDASVAELRKSFSNRATVADVSVVKANDIEITRQGGVLTLSTEYSVKVPLAGNLSACLDFEVSAQQ